jgi:rhodanese-related sulfurtransferase
MEERGSEVVMNRNRASVLVEVLVLTLIALVLGVAVHTFRSSGGKIEWFQSWPDATTPPPVKTPEAPAAPDPLPKQETNQGPINAEPKHTSSPPPVIETTKKVNEVIREITVEEAILEHKNNTPFLDARRTRDYDKGHIPGAISMSVWEPNLDGRISDLLSKVDPGMTVVVYCTGGECTDSHNLATSLQGAGYKDLRIMKGGVLDWVKLGGPAAEKTPGADSSEEGE